MDFSKISHLPLAAVLATAIMVGMPALARLQPKPADDPWTRNRPPTCPASGTLLYQGKPVSAAMVIFVPEAADGGREFAAFGMTDEAGRFFLRTFSRFGDGAVAGAHRIKVECMVPTGRIIDDPLNPEAEARFPPVPVSVGDPAALSAGGETLGYPEMRNILPERFADPRTSGLSAEVLPDVINEYVIRIHAEPPSAGDDDSPHL